MAAADLVLIPRSRDGRGTATRSAASNASSRGNSPRPVAGRETLAPREALCERDVQACARRKRGVTAHHVSRGHGRAQREGTPRKWKPIKISTARHGTHGGRGAPDRPAKARSARAACGAALHRPSLPHARHELPRMSRGAVRPPSSLGKTRQQVTTQHTHTRNRPGKRPPTMCFPGKA